jgi:AbrB family looped-hinge helix DNA binding protein
MVTLGERGQVVIPQAMRDRLGLKAGDKLMVFMKHEKFIGLVPATSFRGWLGAMFKKMTEAEENHKNHNGQPAGDQPDPNTNQNKDA